MWQKIARYVLRNRILNLSIIFLLTAFMAFKATRVQLSYDMVRMLPASDSASIAYENFKSVFGEDGTVLFIGIQSEDLFKKEVFSDWYDLTQSLDKVKGVKEAISVANAFYLIKDTVVRKLVFVPILNEKPTTQNQVDSVKNIILNLPFYDQLLYNKQENAHSIMLTLNEEQLNSKKRFALIEDIQKQTEAFSEKHNIEIHYSGMPYIRTMTMKKIKSELRLFIVLALVLTAIMLYLFFRSFKAVGFPMLIVIIGVIWVMGLIELLHYKITVLTGIVPPLLIIIVIENCIFFLNKYHREYKLHGNKALALTRLIMRIGNATLITNATTAIGFATFLITRNKILIEFSVIASISVMLGYIFSLILIPTFFSYTNPPAYRHIKHLDNKLTKKIVKNIIWIGLFRRKQAFIITSILIMFALFGVTRLTNNSRIVDDIPKKDVMYKDLLFFQKHYKGIMPLEIDLDTKKKGGALRLSVLNRMDSLHSILRSYPNVSKPLSIVDIVKSATQAFYNGNPERYELPNRHERNFIISYVPDLKDTSNSLLNSFIDTARQRVRISAHIANISTHEIAQIRETLQPQVDSLFPPDKYDVKITGTSLVFLKGSRFLIKNLITSLIVAVVVISLLMALLFSTFRMVLVSIIPNLIPLLITAGMMGFLNIPIKPSTVLVFSIAFGISVNGAIHFLAKYRQELKYTKWNIRESVIISLHETGLSLMYSAIVLFFGFIIFAASGFGGTKALGILVSMTLFVAFFANIIILPSLLLSLKIFTTKSFRRSILTNFSIYSKEDDGIDRTLESRKSHFLHQKVRNQKKRKKHERNNSRRR